MQYKCVCSIITRQYWEYRASAVPAHCESGYRARSPIGVENGSHSDFGSPFRPTRRAASANEETPTLASRWISKHTNPHWHLFRSRSVLRACTNSTMATIAWNDRCFRARIAIVPDTPYSCRERNARQSLHHLGRHRKRGMAGSLLSSLPQLGLSLSFAHSSDRANCPLVPP